MKNLSLVFNVILLIAVAILYYFHFSAKSAAPVISIPTMKSFNIAYVNSDSLLDQYNYFKNKKSELEEKQTRMKSELKSESSKLQSEVEDYQQKAALMSDQDRRKLEEQLTMKQQMLMQKKDDLLSKLDEEQSKTNDELYNKLTSFMKAYNKQRNYSFILGFQRGGGILFANDSLNITKDVVSGLNEEFAKEQKTNK